MKRTFKRFTVGLSLAMGAVWVGAGSPSAGAILAVETDPSEAARPGGPSAAVADCEALFATRPLPGHPRLPTADFTTIQDAPTQVTEARVVDAAGDVPAHCRVEGYVSPNVGIVLRLPGSSDWNGNFLEASPGGYGGSTGSGRCDEGLRRGYACITHDTGHTGWSSRASWAYNNLQAEFDYGIRGHHVVALAGKAIIEHYYGRAPEFSYHMGCSGGGKQGMVEAQRFPWNFDGILAMEPSSVTASGVMIMWNAVVMHDENGNPLFTPADLDVLHEGAIAACDADDGLEDGIIGGDPRTCTFDPAELTCERGQRSGCLSPVQVEAARKVYEGPVTSEGEKLSRYFPWYPATPGSEKGVYFSMDLQYKTNYWQYMGFNPDPGPSWTSSDFDFDHDYKRTGVMDALVNYRDDGRGCEWLQQSRSA
jgi:feruloyl esterase